MTTPLEQALVDMADAFQHTIGVGAHFTCTEADAVARVLALAGNADTAATFLAEHSTGDDDEMDLHVGMTDFEDYVAA